MSNPPFPAAARTAEWWAEVRAHDRVIRYRRSGVGRAVLLLLRAPDDSEPLWPELLDGLDRSFRLIVPEAPSAGADVASWLADFLEGLGVSSVRILAFDPFCIPALELALLEADQIDRIVLVPNGSGAGTRGAGRGALATAMREVAVPLLVLRRGQPVDETLPLVTAFLEAEGAATAA